eukprot:scaffold109024_cov36-Phaeocystis_antarctica.AAC.1
MNSEPAADSDLPPDSDFPPESDTAPLSMGWPQLAFAAFGLSFDSQSRRSTSGRARKLQS